MQTVFRSFEMITQDLSYDLSSVTTESSADNDILADILDAAPYIMEEIIGSTDISPKGKTEIYSSYQKGPNGLPALESHDQDLEALGNSHLLGPLFNLLGILNEALRDVLIPPTSLYRVMAEYFEGIDPNDELARAGVCNVYTILQNFTHSLLTVIEDGKWGKTRNVAIGDIITQSAFTGLNRVLMDIIRGLSPLDVTFDQFNLPARIASGCSTAGGVLPVSFDSTAFTDRLPRELNHKIMCLIFGDVVGDLWLEIIGNRLFSVCKQAVQKGCPQNVSYAVGTPMGILTSWSSSVIVHHLLVRFCHKAVNAPYNYVILGDDVNIWDRDVALRYSILMRRLGMTFSEAKCTNSIEYSEMAKRSFIIDRPHLSLPGHLMTMTEVTGLPASASSKLSSGEVTGITGYADQLISRQTSFLVRIGAKPLPFSGKARVAAQLIYLLAYMFRHNRFAYYKLVTYIYTWVFSNRNELVITPVRVDKAWMPMVTELLSSIHGCTISLSGYEGNILQISSCLAAGDICYKPLYQRLQVYQCLVIGIVDEAAKRAANALTANFKKGQPKNLKVVAQAQLVVNLSDQLWSKVNLYLFEAADLTIEANLKGIYDYRANDVLNRLAQVFAGASISRREIQQLRDNEVGLLLREQHKQHGTEALIANYERRNLLFEYLALRDDLYRRVMDWDKLDPAGDEFMPHWNAYISYCIGLLGSNSG
jgi:hypothetical protein